MKLLTENDEPKYKEHLEKLVEPTKVIQIGEDYDELSFCLEKNYDYATWKQKSIQERAEIMAVSTLKGMVSIVDRNYQIIEENRRNLGKKNASSRK